MSFTAKTQSTSGVSNNISTGQQQPNLTQQKQTNDTQNLPLQNVTQTTTQAQNQLIANNIHLLNAATNNMTPMNLQQFQLQQQQFATLQQTALLLQQQQFLHFQQAQQNSGSNEPLVLTRTSDIQSRSLQQANGNANVNTAQQVHQLLQNTASLQGSAQSLPSSLLSLFQQAQQQMTMPFQTSLTNLNTQNVPRQILSQSQTTQQSPQPKQVPSLQKTNQTSALKSLGSTHNSSPLQLPTSTFISLPTDSPPKASQEVTPARIAQDNLSDIKVTAPTTEPIQVVSLPPSVDINSEILTKEEPETKKIEESVSSAPLEKPPQPSPKTPEKPVISPVTVLPVMKTPPPLKEPSVSPSHTKEENTTETEFSPSKTPSPPLKKQSITTVKTSPKVPTPRTKQTPRKNSKPTKTPLVSQVPIEKKVIDAESHKATENITVPKKSPSPKVEQVSIPQEETASPPVNASIEKSKEKVVDSPKVVELQIKRNRLKTIPYQSPIPEVEFVTKLSVSEARASSPKSNQDKLILFYKGEFLAVRNADSGFFLCQTLHNVYKSSPRIRIRWLSEQKKNDDVYMPDFYDSTDIECVLTTLELGKANKSNYRLSKKERDRIENILKKAIDVEKGILPRPDVTEENPDGLDLSLYKDESQIEKKIPQKRKANDSQQSPKDNKKKIKRTGRLSTTHKTTPKKRNSDEDDVEDDDQDNDEDYRPSKKKLVSPIKKSTSRSPTKRNDVQTPVKSLKTPVKNLATSNRATRAQRLSISSDNEIKSTPPIPAKLMNKSASAVKTTSSPSNKTKHADQTKEQESRTNVQKSKAKSTKTPPKAFPATPSTSTGRTTRNSRI